MSPRKIVLLVFGAIIAIALTVGIAGGSSSGGGGKASTPVAPVAPAPSKAAPPKVVVNERADLDYFKLDDRSSYGINDIWTRFSVTNHSSKESDYMWEWQATDASGVRVANGTEIIDNVLPGQTATGDDFTTLTSTDVTMTITSFDRTESW